MSEVLKSINSIKSNIILKKIFNLVNEDIKLKLIKYNKKMQNNLNIKIINYQRFSGRYIIYETKTRGKEFNWNNEKLFEGEYLNGERNGKGKEYINNEIKFEGEYLKGKKNGQGKEFDKNGNIMFEGYYLDGKKWEGKGYDPDHNIIYELNNGKGNIKVYDFYNGQLIFEGEYEKGQRNGKGKEFDGAGNLIFDGEFKNGKKWNGKYYNNINNGDIKFKNNPYESNDINKKVDDNSFNKLDNKKDNEEYNPFDELENIKNNNEYNYYNELIDKDKIDGEKENINEREEHNNENNIVTFINGYGYITKYDPFLDKLVFEGQYSNGERNGKGIEYYDDHGKFEGQYKNGKKKWKRKRILWFTNNI